MDPASRPSAAKVAEELVLPEEGGGSGAHPVANPMQSRPDYDFPSQTQDGGGAAASMLPGMMSGMDFQSR